MNKNRNNMGLLGLLLSVIVLVVAVVLLLTAGFGRSFSTEGGWVISVGMSTEFDPEAEDADTDSIVRLAESLVPGATASIDDGVTTNQYYLTVKSYTEPPVTAEAFVEAVNAEYEELLYAARAKTYHLSPSFAARDLFNGLIAFVLLMLVSFVVAALLLDVKSALLAVLGELYGAVMVFALVLIARIPLGSTVVAAAAVGAVLSFALSLMKLRAFTRAQGEGKAAADGAAALKVNGEAGRILLVLAVAVALVFCVVGLIFGANTSWYIFSALLLISVLPSLCYSWGIIPLFFGK